MISKQFQSSVNLLPLNYTQSDEFWHAGRTKGLKSESRPDARPVNVDAMTETESSIDY
jgi:hypothetical protein